MSKLQPIETSRLLIREIIEQDFEDVYLIKSNPEVVKFLTWGPSNKEQTLIVLGNKLSFKMKKTEKYMYSQWC
jgi:[ribosomal protein S5]-alanine N-acetyltransferase